jgi:PDZ domain-containing protein
MDEATSVAAEPPLPPPAVPPFRPSPAPRRRRLWQGAGSVLALIVTAVIVGGLLIKVPYVALSPGSARDTEDLVEVEGVAAYPSDGTLLFTTVRVQTRPNLWQYLWLDTMADDVEIVPEELILQDRSPDENRKANLEQMTSSKSTAVAVALEQLGYDAITPGGVRAVEVVEGSAAAAVMAPGDTVVAADGQPVLTRDDLFRVLDAKAPGDEITLRIEPAAGGPTKDVTVTLGDSSDQPGRAFLGIGPADKADLHDDEFGFIVDIDSGSVGGPSAGLAFTLAVLDKLTEGELTGGAKVAVTGTIDPTGHVGAVGGVPQKAVAVRQAGASAFLVPTGLGEAEIAEVRRKVGDEVQVIPVDNVEEALNALATLGGQVDAVHEFAAGNASGGTS